VLRVRTVQDAADFGGASEDPDHYTDQIMDLYASGESQPEWCFVVEEGHDRVGRIGFLVQPTMSDPTWLGTLPECELSTFGFDLPWSGGFENPGRVLFAAAADTLVGSVPDLLEIRINNDVHSHPTARCHLLENLGFELFTEKQGFTWNDDGSPLGVPKRLTYRSIEDVGIDAYRAIMGRCGDGTLDRNDRYYWDGCGAENWARQMTEYIVDADMPMWLIGYAGDDPVGYVAVATEEDWGSTIVHIGVVPEHRGNGYIDDLIASGTAAAQASGVTSMLSDVDVVNIPMMKAMRRAGHSEDARPWHVWTYRADLASIVAHP
jgi:RimJ/RimL family protein N-acetyltransferase